MKRSLLVVAVLSWVFFSVAALADERPVLPEPGEDMKLTGGKPVAEFFQARATQTACREELSELREQLQAGHTEVRDAFYDRMSECGPCAVRPIEKYTVDTAARTENWYVSDGSCQLDTKDTAKLAQAYSHLADSLLHVRQYPARNGGFSNLLEFIGVDNRTGDLLPDLDRVTKPPFYSYLAIKGPKALGVQTAFSYYIRNTFTESEKDGVKQFALTFKGVRAPRGFQPPEVYAIGEDGQKTRATVLKLSSVHGFWYLSSTGYLRYHTAADFGASLPLQFASDLAKRILLETLVQLSDRVQVGEKVSPKEMR